MPRDQFKFPVTPVSTSLPVPSVPVSGKIKFSFQFFEPNHDTVKKASFKNPYPKELLMRLKEFETWTVQQFIQCKDKPYRIHPIDWKSHNVQYKGFGLGAEYDETAWQFSIKGNTYGRVHGFFIENVFYIVWLDPNHKVYPKK